MNERTDNPFARALVFYYDYRRNKLSEDILSKIAKKYKSDPTKLLNDLVSKYKLYNNGKYISSYLTSTIVYICTDTLYMQKYLLMSISIKFFVFKAQLTSP